MFLPFPSKYRLSKGGAGKNGQQMKKYIFDQHSLRKKRPDHLCSLCPLTKAMFECGWSHRRDEEASAMRVNLSWSPGVFQTCLKIAKLWKKFQPSS